MAVIPGLWADLLDTPALVVDLDVLERNIATMVRATRERGVALRPHVKTHKTPQIADMQREYGAVGMTCATLGEASMLAAAGHHDIFVAYPIWPGGPKGQLLRELSERVSLSVGLDSTESAAALGTAFRGQARALRVLVEVDVGGRRTGVRPADAGAIAVAAQRAGLDVLGVFTHGGHSYGLGAAARRAAHDEVVGLTVAVESMQASGVPARVVSAGSTPTALLSAEGLVTEERPGTYVFGDRQQVTIGSCSAADIALTVISTVVSRAVPDQIVIDAGTKCLGREIQSWLDGYADIANWPSIRLTGLYDHHGVGVVPEGDPRPKVGSLLR
ncbi:MAG: alanine racemase, partial [Antricoccus sp.]